MGQSIYFCDPLRPFEPAWGQGTGKPPRCQGGRTKSHKTKTEYEIKLTAQDPDGLEGQAEPILKGRTRKLPATVKATPEKYGVNFEFTLPAQHDYKQGTLAGVFPSRKKK